MAIPDDPGLSAPIPAAASTVSRTPKLHGNRHPTALATDDLDDRALVELWADENAGPVHRQAAFHTLVQRYQRRLFSVCHRILGSPQDAEDAVQETFVRLARHASSFRGDAQVSTWLYSIARNVCTDRVRYSARRPAVPVEDIAIVGSETPDADEMAASDTAGMLRDALAQLDEHSRMLLLLIAVDELTYDEAAELTGLAVGTVKSRVSRARAQLGRMLAGVDDAPEALSVDAIEPGRARRDPTADPRGPPRP